MKILDCSCIVYLFKSINEPNVLLEWKKQGYLLVIPQDVHNELCRNEETINRIKPYIQDGSITVVTSIPPEAIERFKMRHPALGNGEISVILVAKELTEKRKRYYAVIDDLRARKVANKYDIKLSNTFNLLLRLKDKSLISQEYYASTKEKFKQIIDIDVERLEHEYRNKC